MIGVCSCITFEPREQSRAFSHVHVAIHMLHLAIKERRIVLFILADGIHNLTPHLGIILGSLDDIGKGYRTFHRPRVRGKEVLIVRK